MGSPSTHFLQVNQPLGQEISLLSASPRDQVLGSPVNDQNHTNLSSLWLSLEQQRLQLDQFLQVHNATLFSLVESTISDALMQKNGEIARLLMEMQQMQEILSTTEHQREAWRQLALEAYEINQSFVVLQPGMQGTNSHASSNELDSACSGNQELNMNRSAVETAQPNLKCKLCNADVASMLILPCQHLCACKSCGVQLLTCPICNTAKVDAMEVRFD